MAGTVLALPSSKPSNTWKVCAEPPSSMLARPNSAISKSQSRPSALLTSAPSKPSQLREYTASSSCPITPQVTPNATTQFPSTKSCATSKPSVKSPPPLQTDI